MFVVVIYEILSLTIIPLLSENTTVKNERSGVEIILNFVR